MIHLGRKIFLPSIVVAVIYALDGSKDNRYEHGMPSHSSDVTNFTKIEELVGRDIQNLVAIRDIKRKVNLELESLIEEAEACRKNYSNLNDQVFGLRLYGFLVDELAGTPNKTTIFHCSLNKRLVDSVKEKLHQLEAFQKSFVLNPKNNSTESPGEQRNPHKETRSHFQRGFKGGIENDLSLVLEDEWKAKVPYVSHIYLGSSIFPILTEESRIIERGYTTPQTAMKRAELQKKGTVARVYQLLTPFRWSKNLINQKNITRLVRGTNQRNLTSSKKSTQDLSDERFAPENPNVELLSESSSNVNSAPCPPGRMTHPTVCHDGDSLYKAVHFVFGSLGQSIKNMFRKVFKQ